MADETLQWAKKARNQVVKQRGLESRSQATVTLTYSHLGPQKRQFDVPPILPTPLLWRAAIEGVPLAVLGNAMLEIRREWISDGLPNRELLQSFAEAYRVLDALVDDLTRFVADGKGMEPSEALSSAVPLECMASFRDAQTLRINPATGETFDLVAEPHEYDPALGQRAAERYGLTDNPPQVDPEDAVAYAEVLVETSKRILERDGHHVTLAMLHAPGGPWQHRLVLAREKLEKFVLWREIAEEIGRMNIDALIVIGEAWAAPPGSIKNEMYPDLSKAKGRLEVLTVNLETREGLSIMWTTVFKKKWSVRGKRVVFESTVREDFDETPMGFLTPVRKIWAANEGQP